MNHTSVHLNRVIIHVDEATRSAIMQSAFLKNEFAAFETGTIAIEDGGGWSGLYIDGERTYIEIFGPSQGAATGGAAGICLGVDQTGGLEDACVALSRSGRAHSPDLVGRQLDGQEIPWFRYVDLVDSGTSFTSSIMEYDKDFLRRSRPGPNAGLDCISRQQYNAARFQPERYLKDISEVTLALAPVDLALFGSHLETLGYVETSVGEARTFCGQEVIFHLMQSTASVKGVVALRLSLLKKKDGETVYRFGPGSVLHFDAEFGASWFFGPASG
ncbi:MAG: hypothetical protein JWQ61_1206 [Collimonas fungivorans]|uniref:DUF5829 family protein n=1 Tax=Collimonas fungivorans TaxID=158899 RepID=UPI0026EF1BFB|nr:DUF5829 family protein [Collimonas fungivorans]MDB5766392.1 hypothetical protein [Collimonas fungivorans]